MKNLLLSTLLYSSLFSVIKIYPVLGATIDLDVNATIINNIDNTTTDVSIGGTYDFDSMIQGSNMSIGSLIGDANINPPEVAGGGMIVVDVIKLLLWFPTPADGEEVSGFTASAQEMFQGTFQTIDPNPEPVLSGIGTFERTPSSFSVDYELTLNSGYKTPTGDFSYIGIIEPAEVAGFTTGNALVSADLEEGGIFNFEMPITLSYNPDLGLSVGDTNIGNADNTISGNSFSTDGSYKITTTVPEHSSTISLLALSTLGAVSSIKRKMNH